MIELTLAIEDINQILSALGQRPYEEVFQLVNKIQQQAQTQLQNSTSLAESNIGDAQQAGE